MKTVFEKQVRDELTARIDALHQHLPAQWGKMNVYQMAKHNTIWNEWVLGRKKTAQKQAFLGKIFGKLALKNNTRDDRPISKGMPAGKYFTVKEKTGDLDAEKKLWISLVNDYETFSSNTFFHDFFGEMTKEQVGIFAYKHSDHHLRQFGV